MCKVSAPKPPPVVQRDPVKEAAQAEAQAQRVANAEIASRRRRLRGNSLFTNGARGTPSAPRFSAYAQAQAVTPSGNLGGT